MRGGAASAALAEAKRKLLLQILVPRFLIVCLSLFPDIRDLISLEDVMEELELGPNGGLVYCMEYPLKRVLCFSARKPRRSVFSEHHHVALYQLF